MPKKVFCLAMVLGRSVAVAPTWAGEAERYLNEGDRFSREGDYAELFPW